MFQICMPHSTELIVMIFMAVDMRSGINVTLKNNCVTEWMWQWKAELWLQQRNWCSIHLVRSVWVQMTLHTGLMHQYVNQHKVIFITFEKYRNLRSTFRLICVFSWKVFLEWSAPINYQLIMRPLNLNLSFTQRRWRRRQRRKTWGCDFFVVVVVFFTISEEDNTIIILVVQQISWSEGEKKRTPSQNPIKICTNHPPRFSMHMNCELAVF